MADEAKASKSRGLYRYSPLLAHPNSIRLLRLLPASRAEDSVHCQIFDYSLTNPPRVSHLYECLSYVWGDVQDKPTIHVDDAELAVTKNLHGALRRLRDPYLDRILWVDAICINQDDVEERAQQVQIMALIYAYASRVVVWLGEEADGSQEAMELLREDADRVHRRLRSFPGAEEDESQRDECEMGFSGDVPLGNNTLKSAIEQGKAPSSSPRSEAMALLKRPWFQRIWVLQEIAAARVMVILCGSEELTGTCFFWALSGLLDWCDDALLRGVVLSILYLVSNASALRLNKPDREPFRLGICPLSQLLDMFRLREASDRRDKVYALLGIMSSDPATSNIVPDYGKEWAELFQDLVRSMLGQKVKAVWISKDGHDHGRVSGKGCIVGYISEVDNSSNHYQRVSITPTYHRSPMAHQRSDKTKLRWILHNSTAEVRHGDIVCWLKGSNGATIIRFQGNCFTIVVVLANFPPILVKSLFQEGRELTHHSSDDSEDMLPPIQHSRTLVLTWSFDPTWTTQGIDLAPSLQAEPEVMSTLSDMIRVLEDVNDTDAIQSLFERGIRCQGGELAPIGVLEHFHDLRQTLPNWDLYLRLKTDLQNVLCGEVFVSGLPNDIGLDLVEIRARLTAYPEHGTELIKSLFNEVSFLSSTNSRIETFYDQIRRIKLALVIDIWGHTIAADTMLALVEFIERIDINQRTTLGSFPSPLSIEVVEILVHSSAQHPEWGMTLVERFIGFAKGNVNRMYCLLRAFIVSSAAASAWKQQVVEAVLATHMQEVSEAIVDKDAWSSLEIVGRYAAIIDFLWSHYVLSPKDFVGISISGTFQLRSQLMEKFVNDYRFWKACYDGSAADIWNGVRENGRVDPQMLVICKDVRGRWCRVAAFEAAAMNGHVECCKLLLERGFDYRITSALRMQLCDKSIPNAKEIAELLTTHNLADWEIRTVAEGSSGAAFGNGRRSETW